MGKRGTIQVSLFINLDEFQSISLILHYTHWPSYSSDQHWPHTHTHTDHYRNNGTLKRGMVCWWRTVWCGVNHTAYRGLQRSPAHSPVSCVVVLKSGLGLETGHKTSSSWSRTQVWKDLDLDSDSDIDSLPQDRLTIFNWILSIVWFLKLWK